MPTPLRRTPDSNDADTAGEKALSSLLDMRARLRAGLVTPAEEDRTAPDDRSSDAEALLSFIGGEIIPRLMLAHQVASDAESADESGLTPEIHARFVEIVLDGTELETRHFVDHLLARNVSLEVIFVELLTNTARRLGELWENDERSFGEVTIGLLRLHHVLRERRLDSESRRPAHVDGGRSRILLVTACGDQHVFGLLMVSEFFRKAGWSVISEPGNGRDQIESILRREVFDLLGLSASCTTVAEQIRDEIEVYRAASCNPRIKVLVGGRLFATAPDLVEYVGADGAALDPYQAIDTAEALVGRTVVCG